MAELTVEKVYGKALYEAAKDLGRVDEILDEIETIRGILKEDADFREFFQTPVLSGPEKKKVIETVFRGKASDEVVNFLCILVDKRRTSAFSRITDVYRTLLEESRGISSGTVYSVEPLSDSQIASFDEQAGKLFGKKVKLENRLDPTMLGGVKIFLEGKVLDASIKKRLLDLEGSMKRV